MNPTLLPREFSTLGPTELLVNETFLSIQGESSFAGRPCFFIRLTGCHLRCGWCDSEYAFHEGKRMPVSRCLELASGSRLVEITGGEPLLQKAVHPLMRALCDRGHQVLLETSGGIPIDGVDGRVQRIVDWKAPGSGESHRNLPSVLKALKPGDELKIVLLDRQDYEWARDWLEATRADRSDIGTSIPVHFSPVFGRLENADLASWILEDRIPVRLQLQLHKFIWSPDTRGK